MQKQKATIMESCCNAIGSLTKTVPARCAVLGPGLCVPSTKLHYTAHSPNPTLCTSTRQNPAITPVFGQKLPRTATHISGLSSTKCMRSQ